jgi:hypothetical protein
MTETKIFFINNGERYPEDFAVIGAVIGKESDRDTIGAIVRYAEQEYHKQVSEFKERRDLYRMDHPTSTTSEYLKERAEIGAYPDENITFVGKFKEHGFVYVPFNHDFEAYV